MVVSHAQQMETHPVDPGGRHTFGDWSGVGHTLVLGLRGRLRMPRGTIPPWRGLPPAHVAPGGPLRSTWSRATIHAELSILAGGRPLAAQPTTLLRLDSSDLMPIFEGTLCILQRVMSRERGAGCWWCDSRAHCAAGTLFRGPAGDTYAGQRQGLPFAYVDEGETRDVLDLSG